MIIFTGICCAALFAFEILYPWLKKSAGLEINIKTHKIVGIFAVLAAFLHLAAAGFPVNFSVGYLLLILFVLTVLSGALIKSLSKYFSGKVLKAGKLLKAIHVALSIMTAMVLVFHILQEII